MLAGETLNRDPGFCWLVLRKLACPVSPGDGGGGGVEEEVDDDSVCQVFGMRTLGTEEDLNC